MDGVTTAGWVLIFLMLAFIHIGIPMTMALVTGGLCGWCMSRLSVKRGLATGALVAIPGTVIYGIEIFVSLPVSPRLDLVMLTNIAATIGLCWWWNRRSQTGRCQTWQIFERRKEEGGSSSDVKRQ